MLCVTNPDVDDCYYNTARRYDKLEKLLASKVNLDCDEDTNETDSCHSHGVSFHFFAAACAYALGPSSSSSVRPVDLVFSVA